MTTFCTLDYIRATVSHKLKQIIINALKKFKLAEIKREVLGTNKFILHVLFDGIIQPGETMTINQLAEIVIEGFATVNARLDGHDVILKEHGEILKEHSKILNEHSEILKEHSEILKEYGKILNEHSKTLKEHSDIFKRNNLK